MNEIQIFSNPQFGEIRTAIGENGEPMFCLADACKALELSNPRQVKARLNAKGVQLIDLQGVNNNDGVIISELGNTTANFINEANLYKCIFQSRKPEAEKFQDWVCEEVLPSIRKQGGYIVARKEDTPEEIMARAVLVAQATIEKQNKRIAEQAAKIEADAPKVLFAESVTASDDMILIRDFAKMLRQNGCKTGEKRLYQWMRENGYICKGSRMPTQRAMELELFFVHERTVVNGSKSKQVQTTKITGKGQEYFTNKLLSNQTNE